MPADDRPWVICVDDEVNNLRVFELNFQARFRVRTFSTAAEALEFVKQNAHEVGVLITDQRMPEMTGVDLLAQVKDIAPDSQRMMLTAFADNKAMADAVNLGQVTRYFGKPWSKEELSAAIDDALRIFGLIAQMRQVQARMVQSERLATLGQVSAGIAHELMNPVAYLTHNLTTLRAELQERGPLGDLTPILDDLDKGVRHVSDVATGIKNQARGTDDEGAVSDLAQVASFAVKIARSEVRQRARIASDSEPAAVRGSEHKLCQVLLNLILNAAQAIEGRPGLIEVRWTKAPGGVVLEVIDNGGGIPPEHLPRVFDRFFTTKGPGKGTGLGLAICKEQVESMGGEISIRSTVGQGTTVQIRLRAPP